MREYLRRDGVKEESQLRLDEFRKQLLEKRKNEVIKESIQNEFNVKAGHGITSPTSDTTTEELRLFMEYMDVKNVMDVSKYDESKRQALLLKKFLKTKRNQQVEIYSKNGKKSLYTEGKVTAIGRDFVMLTNLKDRIWIPYKAIVDANIPYGIPNYSNSHQHFIYDNDLRNKLVRDFGNTVSKRDALVQQFYEESIQTNIDSWKGTIVEVLCGDQRKIGKIVACTNGILHLVTFKEKDHMPIDSVYYIKTIRYVTFVSSFVKKCIKGLV